MKPQAFKRVMDTVGYSISSIYREDVEMTFFKDSLFSAFFVDSEAVIHIIYSMEYDSSLAMKKFLLILASML